MSEVRSAEGVAFDFAVPVLVVGAGAAGLVAALSVREAGLDVLVVERDRVPRGSTALSAGLIPAAGTKIQKAAGIADDPALFAADILKKAHDTPEATAVETLTRAIGPVIDHLADHYGLAFTVIDDFAYPGHSARRMHGLPTRSGGELCDRLREAAVDSGVEILTDAKVTTLFAARDGRVAGAEIVRPDGGTERIGCAALVLACNGYGANKSLVGRYIPELADALYLGHPGNEGDAVLWGEALGAAVRHLSGHQGHGSVATPQSILITWATMTEGGFQVNLGGARFHDESKGYSEAAAEVLRQREGVAFSVFDERIADIARQFEDFRNAEAQGALRTADTIAGLAERCGLPADALAATFASVAAGKLGDALDRFGRALAGVPQLTAPFHAVKVTGALFHTQGGLVVDAGARVLRPDGAALPNLFAAGGAACGVSGPDASGYLSGNGLLAAVGYGALAGRAAARLVEAAIS
jgi:fumarate reductase flavoprotein subunit